MIKLKITFISLILFSGWIITGCEGPAGPAGSDGQEGPQGLQGVQGEQGNANVMYSDWMNIEWEENSSDTNKEMAIHESQITENFLNSGGVVLMFLKIQGEAGTIVYTLPIINATGQFHFGFASIDSDVALGGNGLQGIIFWLRSLDGQTPVPDEMWMNFQIRYVLIPGSSRIQGKGFDYRDYKQVSELFGIID